MPIAESNGNLSNLEGDEGQVFTTSTNMLGSDLNYKYLCFFYLFNLFKFKICKKFESRFIVITFSL